MKYKLNSSELISTPSIIAMVIRQFDWDPDWSIKMLVEGYHLPEPVAHALASGSLKYQVDLKSETVTFEA